MRFSVGVLGVIHGLNDRSLIGPPLLDGRASSTIEHDIMRRVREWMADGRVPSDFTKDSSRAPLGGYEDMLRPEIVNPRANVRSHFPTQRPQNPHARLD